MLKKSKKEFRDQYLELATSYEGYVAAAGSPDIFSSAAGTPGAHWNGIYVDVVMKRAGLEVPAAHITPNVAMQSYLKRGRLHLTPQPGDVAFYVFPTDPSNSAFNQMHIGIVLNTDGFSRDGSFKAIEAQVDAGTPKAANKIKNGVHVRTRYITDVIGFGRPDFSRKTLTDENVRAHEASGPDGKLLTKPTVRVNSTIMKPGLKHKDVAIIQAALKGLKLFTGTVTGMLDHKTQSSVANFQRSIGYVGVQVTGIPDLTTLNRLAAAAAASGSGPTFNVI